MKTESSRHKFIYYVSIQHMTYVNFFKKPNFLINPKNPNTKYLKHSTLVFAENNTMRTTRPSFLLLISAAIFTWLFYDRSLGVNLLIYEISILLYLGYEGAIQLKNQRHLIGLLAVVLSCAMTILHHSTLSYVIHFLICFLYVGALSSPEIRSLPYIWANSISSFFITPGYLPGVLFNKKNEQNKKRSGLWRILKLFIIPMLIIIVFIMIYSGSNPEFGAFFTWLSYWIENLLENILRYIEPYALGVFLFGLLISGFILIRRKDIWAVTKDANGNDELLRKRKNTNRKFKFLGLLNEYRSSVFLFVSLNALLLLLNIMDINHVWFNFKWEGQYLKEYVHQGTYLLIISILISIVLVLFYFRRNLNFYSKNKLLKQLTYVWLVQNAFLVVSVGLRNWYYISYYALAYKRIAVVFFLLLVLLALYTVFMKVKTVRSTYYLVRTNTYALMFILLIASCFNWDRIIAQYNFSKADRSFVHLNYLATLSDTALPYLDHPLETLKEMDNQQIQKFNPYSSMGSSGSFSLYRNLYMTPQDYVDVIQSRKESFKKKWEAKNWLEWNYAEHNAYHELSKN
jgi:hypothetical protein